MSYIGALENRLTARAREGLAYTAAWVSRSIGTAGNSTTLMIDPGTVDRIVADVTISMQDPSATAQVEAIWGWRDDAASFVAAGAIQSHKSNGGASGATALERTNGNFVVREVGRRDVTFGNSTKQDLSPERTIPLDLFLDNTDYFVLFLLGATNVQTAVDIHVRFYDA